MKLGLAGVAPNILLLLFVVVVVVEVNEPKTDPPVSFGLLLLLPNPLNKPALLVLVPLPLLVAFADDVELVNPNLKRLFDELFDDDEVDVVSDEAPNWNPFVSAGLLLLLLVLVDPNDPNPNELVDGVVVVSAGFGADPNANGLSVGGLFALPNENEEELAAGLVVAVVATVVVSVAGLDVPNANELFVVAVKPNAGLGSSFVC